VDPGVSCRACCDHGRSIFSVATHALTYIHTHIHVGLTQASSLSKVCNIIRGGRFKAVINNDDQFVEEYGPDDENKEWRRTTRYGGLKRQRKSVEHYQVSIYIYYISIYIYIHICG